MKLFKKVILAVLVMIILSGCTVKDKITVSYDGKVSEEVTLLDSNEKFRSSELNFKQVVDSMIKSYKTLLDYKKYSYDYVEGKKFSGVKIYKTYNNICSYFGNSGFNQYVYKYMDCTEHDDYIEIKNATEQIAYCEDCPDLPALSNVEYRITLPVSAVEQNADQIDGNTYIWKYGKDVKDKNFYLKINKSDLKKYEQKYVKKENHRKTIRKYTIIITIGLAITIISIIGINLYIKIKKNKLDY